MIAIEFRRAIARRSVVRDRITSKKASTYCMRSPAGQKREGRRTSGQRVDQKTTVRRHVILESSQGGRNDPRHEHRARCRGLAGHGVEPDGHQLLVASHVENFPSISPPARLRASVAGNLDASVPLLNTPRDDSLLSAG